MIGDVKGETMRIRGRVVIGLATLVAVMAIAVTAWMVTRGPTSEPAPAGTATFAENPYTYESTTRGEAGASTLESVLTVGAMVVFLGGCLAAITWAQRRRARGEEASTYNAEGAESGAGLGSSWGGGLG